MKFFVNLGIEIDVDESTSPAFLSDNIEEVLKRFVRRAINNSTYLEIGLPEAEKNVVLDPQHFKLFGILVRRI